MQIYGNEWLSRFLILKTQQQFQSNQSIKGINTVQKQINEDDFKKFDILTQISDGDYYC